jgi:hypothetical protein
VLLVLFDYFADGCGVGHLFVGSGRSFGMIIFTFELFALEGSALIRLLPLSAFACFLLLDRTSDAGGLELAAEHSPMANFQGSVLVDESKIFPAFVLLVPNLYSAIFAFTRSSRISAANLQTSSQ